MTLNALIKICRKPKFYADLYIGELRTYLNENRLLVVHHSERSNKDAYWAALPTSRSNVLGYLVFPGRIDGLVACEEPITGVDAFLDKWTKEQNAKIKREKSKRSKKVN